MNYKIKTQTIIRGLKLIYKLINVNSSLPYNLKNSIFIFNFIVLMEYPVILWLYQCSNRSLDKLPFYKRLMPIRFDVQHPSEGV